MQRELLFRAQKKSVRVRSVCGTLTRTAANGNHHGRRRIGRRAFLDDVRRFDLVDGAHELVHRDGFQRPSRGLRASRSLGPLLPRRLLAWAPSRQGFLARADFEAPIHLIPADTNGQEGGRPSAGTGAGRGRPTSNLVRRRGESRLSQPPLTRKRARRTCRSRRGYLLRSSKRARRRRCSARCPLPLRTSPSGQRRRARNSARSLS